MIHQPRKLVPAFLLLLLTSTWALCAFADETAERGFLGITMKQAGSRAEVLSVVPDGPAASLDLRPGDFVVAFNGSEFYFDRTVDLIKGLKWVTAGVPVQLTIDRQGQLHEVEVQPAPLGRDRQAALDDWILKAELAEVEARKDCAFDTFQEMFSASPIEVVFARRDGNDLADGETDIVVSSSVALPADLDLMHDNPTVRLLVETLKPGDQAKVVYSIKDGMMHEAVTEAPGYVESVFDQYIRSIQGLSKAPGD